MEVFNRGFQLIESISTTHNTATDTYVVSYWGHTHQESLHMLVGYYLLGHSHVLVGHGLLCSTTASFLDHTAQRT